MGSDAKILLTISGLTLIIVVFIVVGSGSPGSKINPEMVNRGGVATGSASAKITLTEFSDFFCPACKAVNPLVDQIIEKYGKDLKFTYRHFPLPQHPSAFKAAQAAEAANLQGRFWDYRNKLFDNQTSLDESSFVRIAQELGLDLEKFKNDLNSETVIKKVQLDASDAKELNLPGTPSFFLDGKKIELSSFEDLAKAVETRIKAK